MAPVSHISPQKGADVVVTINARADHEPAPLHVIVPVPKLTVTLNLPPVSDAGSDEHGDEDDDAASGGPLSDETNINVRAPPGLMHSSTQAAVKRKAKLTTVNVDLPK